MSEQWTLKDWPTMEATNTESLLAELEALIAAAEGDSDALSAEEAAYLYNVSLLLSSREFLGVNVSEMTDPAEAYVGPEDIDLSDTEAADEN